MFICVKDTKNHKNKNYKKDLSLIFNKEQNKISWFKNKNIRIKNKNMRCVRQREDESLLC